MVFNSKSGVNETGLVHFKASVFLDEVTQRYVNVYIALYKDFGISLHSGKSI